MRGKMLLTDREVQILELLRQGLTNKSIGEALNLKTSTIKSHVAHIFTKLGATTRTEAVFLWFK